MADPSEALEAHLEAARGPGLSEQNLQFTLNPERWLQVLADLAKDDPLLWLKNLGQWHTRTAQREPLRLDRVAGGRYRLRLTLGEESFSGLKAADLTLPGQAEPAASFARVLALLPEGSLCGILRQPAVVRERHLLAVREAAEGAPDDDACSVWFEFSASALNIAKVFGARLVSEKARLLPSMGLLPVPLQLEGQPLSPDWPTQTTPGDDSNDNVLWDWESVDAASGGFRWTLPAWCASLDQTAGGWEVLSHPVRWSRQASEAPLTTCVPRWLADDLLSQPGSAERPLHDVMARRVFGVSWNLQSRQPSQCYPVVGGVLGQPVDLPDAPLGLYLLADAESLTADATGLALVRDARFEQWLADQIAWMRQQTRAYLPFLSTIPLLWTHRLSGYAQLHRPKSWLRTASENAVSRFYRSALFRRSFAERRETLLNWAEQETAEEEQSRG